MSAPDPACDPALATWVEGGSDARCEFPVQNLPYGVFSGPGGAPARVGVAIGDRVLDLAMLEGAGLFDHAGAVFTAPALNPFMALGPAAWAETRRTLSALLTGADARLRDDAALAARALPARAQVRMHLPFEVAEFTDFYASREHATNVGTIFRGAANALPPNWLHIPIGYNGRASTVVVSGTPVRRPLGQICPPGSDGPVFRASARLDIELEVGAVVGVSSVMGEPITVAQADRMIFGYVLLNDWSARDIQVWEYQPLGPFQAKAFATTISPWVVTAAALAPFRVSGPRQEPAPLPYLACDAPMNYDVSLEVEILAGGQRTPIAATNFRHLYWSSAQQLAHHASSGCAMRTGDLLGSGTVSGPEPGGCGSLLELAANGKRPVALADGSVRSFLADGDTVRLTGRAERPGYRLGFGECAGTVVPAHPAPGFAGDPLPDRPGIAGEPR